jgi:predicted metal-dependent hydrolase
VIFRNTADLLRQDGCNDFATWRKLLFYLYGRPGTLRLLLLGAFTYMRPGFHPWQIDDRALLTKALAALEAGEAERNAA